jgi:hypothetical protein
MDFKTFHKGVKWDKWFVTESYVFTLVRDPDYVVVCNFGKHNILLYQLLNKRRNYTIVGTYDQHTLSKILGDWEHGKVYVQLKF